MQNPWSLHNLLTFRYTIVACTPHSIFIICYIFLCSLIVSLNRVGYLLVTTLKVIDIEGSSKQMKKVWLVSLPQAIMRSGKPIFQSPRPFNFNLASWYLVIEYTNWSLIDIERLHQYQCSLHHLVYIPFPAADKRQDFCGQIFNINISSFKIVQYDWIVDNFSIVDIELQESEGFMCREQWVTPMYHWVIIANTIIY